MNSFLNSLISANPGKGGGIAVNSENLIVKAIASCCQYNLFLSYYLFKTGVIVVSNHNSMIRQDAFRDTK